MSVPIRSDGTVRVGFCAHNVRVDAVSPALFQSGPNPPVPPFVMRVHPRHGLQVCASDDARVVLFLMFRVAGPPPTHLWWCPQTVRSAAPARRVRSACAWAAAPRGRSRRRARAWAHRRGGGVPVPPPPPPPLSAAGAPPTAAAAVAAAAAVSARWSTNGEAAGLAAAARMVGAGHRVAAGAGAPVGAPPLLPGGGGGWQSTGGLSDARVEGGIGGPSARGALRPYPCGCVWIQLRRLSLPTTQRPRGHLPPTTPEATAARFALYRPHDRRSGRGDQREPRRVAGRRQPARHPRRCPVRCRHGHRRGLCRRRTSLPAAATGCGRRHPPSPGSAPPSPARGRTAPRWPHPAGAPVPSPARAAAVAAPSRPRRWTRPSLDAAYKPFLI